MFKYGEMIRELQIRFPEFKNEIKIEKKNYEGREISIHYFYSEVLNSNLKKILRAENKDNYSLLKNIFLFLEDMANSDDEEVRYLLQVTVLESLWDEKTLLEKAEKLMLPKTREINNDICSYFRRP